MSSDCTRTRSRWILPLILGLAALFRLQGLDLMEYKADEAAASDLARRVARLQSLPRCGLGSGVGVRNPPAFIYLLALPSALTCHPIALTACIALLNVAAVAVCFRTAETFFGRRAAVVSGLAFAVAPWAVIYSRKIWAQNLMPLIGALVLHGLLQIGVRRRGGYTFLVVFLALLAPQIHFAGLCATLAALLVLALCRRAVKGKQALAAAGAAALLLAPYLHLQLTSEFKDVRGAFRVTTGGTAQRSRAHRAADAARHLLSISGMGNMGYVLGASRADFEKTSVKPGVGHAAWLALLALGLISGAVTRPRGALIVVLWLAAAIAVFGATGIKTSPHYLIVAYPAPFLAMGWIARAALPWRRAAFGLLAAAVVLAAVFNTSLLGLVQSEGGTAGDYGVAYRHKAAAAKGMLRRAAAGPLHLSRDARGHSPVRYEYSYLLGLWRDSVPRAGDGMGFVVLEGPRDSLSPRDEHMLRHVPYHDFGPVRVYTITLAMRRRMVR